MSDPVILELTVTSPIVLQSVQNGIAQGKSAYQSYVDTTDDDAADTYAGEFALLDGDVHYQTNRIGSYNEFND